MSRTVGQFGMASQVNTWSKCDPGLEWYLCRVSLRVIGNIYNSSQSGQVRGVLQEFCNRCAPTGSAADLRNRCWGQANKTGAGRQEAGVPAPFRNDPKAEWEKQKKNDQPKKSFCRPRQMGYKRPNAEDSIRPRYFPLFQCFTRIFYWQAAVYSSIYMSHSLQQVCLWTGTEMLLLVCFSFRVADESYFSLFPCFIWKITS